MAYFLYTILGSVDQDMHNSIVETNITNRTSHLLSDVWGTPFTINTLNEYRAFIKKIYNVLDIDLTECNMMTGFFFDPANLHYVSYSVVRALWELVGLNVVQPQHAWSIRLELKRRFEEQVRWCKEDEKPVPRKLYPRLIKGLTADIQSGQFMLQVLNNPGAAAARIGPPFTTNCWIDLRDM